MSKISNLVVDLISASLAHRQPEAVGVAFFEGLRPYGAMAINARGYHSTRDLTTSGSVFVRQAPDSFMPVYHDNRYYAGNPLPWEAQRRSRPFLWSELGWGEPGARWVRDTMSDCGCPNGIIVPCHGPRSYVGVVSVAFDRLSEVAPADLSAILVASHFVHDRMKDLARMEDKRPAASLTPRERDCLLFVSEGRSDKEISALLGVSAATVAFHIGNARVKLGAKTRAHAVAVFLSASFG